jgi:hypothetical protein
MHADLWLGGIFGIAHVDSFGCTHILSTISDLNVGEELAQTGRSYVVRLRSRPRPCMLLPTPLPLLAAQLSTQ